MTTASELDPTEVVDAGLVGDGELLPAVAGPPRREAAGGPAHRPDAR
ncbi:hypothetical protein OG520_42695 (plasmid) [Streptomyces sp. NBC_00984]|nr:hypothetical protein OG520_42695 [Streptomyces sp. NBC_00984]